MERYRPDVQKGLSKEQVEMRMQEQLSYTENTPRTKTIPEIIIRNIITPFNILNTCLALAVILSGSLKNLLFMGVVICNTLISTIQEIHAKRQIDKLSLLATSTAKVVRDGKLQKVSIYDLVLDDIIRLDRGDQVVVDSVIEKGDVEVNESIITGEVEPIYKEEQDMILSGSFISSGTCYARVEHVGIDNYTSKIASGTKFVKKVRSEIMQTLNKVIRVVSMIILPVGILLFLKQYSLHHSLNQAILNTVAAVIGMIPEGLVLLTSTVLAVGVAKLTRYKILVEQLYGLETLARVDTICLDKTGTLTEGDMIITNLVPYHTHSKKEMEELLTLLATNFDDSNATMDAIRKTYPAKVEKEILYQVPFTSKQKWSGVTFQGQTILLGALEFLIKKIPNDMKKLENDLSQDSRVVVLAKSTESLEEKTLPNQIEVVGFIQIQDHIRKEAKQTLTYFKQEGVDIKIISGDHVKTVTSVASKVGITDLKAIDATSLTSYESIKKAVETYQIFGRVTPEQKKDMVKAGSDAARNVSEMVLLDSNFDRLPKILKEGRQIINNIERSATLFLVKTIYATLLAICFLFLPLPYPFVPIQLTLISVTTIGIPSFILALEPNEKRVKKHFFFNIISKSIPTAVTIVESILIVILCGSIFHFTKGQLSTICVLTMGFISFILLFRLCYPFNLLRGTLFGSMLVIFLVGAIGLRELFSLSFLPFDRLIFLAIFLLLAYELYRINLKLFMRIYQTKRFQKIKDFIFS